MAGNGRRNVTYALVVAAVVALVGVVAVPAAPAAPSGWNIVSSASSGPGSSDLLLGTTCPNAWSCWAVGGSFSNLNNGEPHLLADHWDGGSWSVTPVDPPAGSTASLLWNVTCVTASDCWAVGGQQLGGPNGPPSTLAEHWDGSAWSLSPTPAINGYLFSVSCSSTVDCWAAGTSVAADNSDPLNGIMDHWDGITWSAVPTPASGQTYDQFNSVSCTGSSDCWAVGFAGPNQEQSGFLPNTLPNVAGDEGFAEHWDGASWTVANVPQAIAPLGSYLSAVTCGSPSQCWAVGATMDAAGDPAATLVEHWDGSAWTTTPSPSPVPSSGLLTGVTCLDAERCWASGVYGFANGQSNGPTPFIESWNGSQWSIEPSPNVTSFGYLAGLACVRGAFCQAAGFAISNLGNNTTVTTLVEQLQLPAAGNQGLWLAASDGGVFSLGNARFFGSMGGVRLNAPIVGTTAAPDGRGYWLVASDGGVFSFGDARFFGSTGDLHLNRPVVGMASTPDGGGYWLVASDGGVFSFGDARFFGSTGDLHLNRPVVGMASTPDGRGYWLVASDGGVFTFGDARFFGSTGDLHLNRPVVGMASTPDGGGYWLVASDGGVFSFGDSTYWGSAPGQGIAASTPVVGMTSTPDGAGYWLVDQAGGLYAYGDAGFLGALTGLALSGPVTGLASGS